jgi:hypothetical protein
MKKLLLFAILFFVSCSPVNNATDGYFQRQDLIGTWSVTHTSFESCMMNGVSLPPDTVKDKSTYWIYPDSIAICIRQVVRSSCGLIPLPICVPIAKQWTTRHDTLFVYPGNPPGTQGDTARYALSRYGTGEIIFSGNRSVDTCSKE